MLVRLSSFHKRTSCHQLTNPVFFHLHYAYAYLPEAGTQHLPKIKKCLEEPVGLALVNRIAHKDTSKIGRRLQPCRTRRTSSTLVKIPGANGEFPTLLHLLILLIVELLLELIVKLAVLRNRFTANVIPSDALQTTVMVVLLTPCVQIGHHHVVVAAEEPGLELALVHLVHHFAGFRGTVFGTSWLELCRQQLQDLNACPARNAWLQQHVLASFAALIITNQVVGFRELLHVSNGMY